MLIEISRTSDSGGQKQPHKDAVCLQPYQEEPRQWGKWIVYVATLEDLLNFVGDEDLLIRRHDRTNEISIEIVDDWL